MFTHFIREKKKITNNFTAQTWDDNNQSGSALCIEQCLLKSMNSKAPEKENDTWTSVLLAVCVCDRITWLGNYFIMFKSDCGTKVLSSIFVSLGRIFSRDQEQCSLTDIFFMRGSWPL